MGRENRDCVFGFDEQISGLIGGSLCPPHLSQNGDVNPTKDMSSPKHSSLPTSRSQINFE
jgi:hypothetical protein